MVWKLTPAQNRWFAVLDKWLNRILLGAFCFLVVVLYVKMDRSPSPSNRYGGFNAGDMSDLLCKAYEDNLAFMDACLSGLEDVEADAETADNLLTCPEESKSSIAVITKARNEPITEAFLRLEREKTESALRTLNCPGHLLTPSIDEIIPEEIGDGASASQNYLCEYPDRAGTNPGYCVEDAGHINIGRFNAVTPDLSCDQARDYQSRIKTCYDAVISGASLDGSCRKKHEMIPSSPEHIIPMMEQADAMVASACPEDEKGISHDPN